MTTINCGLNITIHLVANFYNAFLDGKQKYIKYEKKKTKSDLEKLHVESRKIIIKKFSGEFPDYVLYLDEI